MATEASLKPVPGTTAVPSSADPKPIIQVTGLRKVYRIGTEKVVALDNITLNIYKGEVCCIVGTSGSGKSTLLNQLAGLEKPTRGEILIGKTNISRLSENRLARFRQRNIGFIFQSYNLLPTYTALENVSLPLMFRGVSPGKRKKAAAHILKQVGLGSRMRHKPTEMSGGQQQRVGIARAFVAKPKIIFADEPTGNLDTRTTVEIMEMMLRFARENKQTLIIVTHNMDLAKYADRVVTLIDGKIISNTTQTSVFDCQEVDEDATDSSPDEANLSHIGDQTIETVIQAVATGPSPEDPSQALREQMNLSPGPAPAGPAGSGIQADNPMPSDQAEQLPPGQADGQNS